jgi:hypothetical protein
MPISVNYQSKIGQWAPREILDGATLKHTENMFDLEESLMELHLSVNKLIKVIQENASTLERGDEVLNKLPLLDFYNDDLLRNIGNMRNLD